MHLSGTNRRTKVRWDIFPVGQCSAKLVATAVRGTLVLAALFLLLLLIAARPALAQNETALYVFGSQSGDGRWPGAGVIFDQNGNLYGTTSEGGASDWGSVYELTADGREKVLYSFGRRNKDGQYPFASLVFDKEGNLYGTTSVGGAHLNGTVFEITAAGKEKVLHSFHKSDGSTPVAGVIFDQNGNLYGTTTRGGAHGGGTVFEITAAGKEKVLHSFGSQSGDGFLPYAGLVFDGNGNLYGTTTQGGAHGNGTVFEITAAGTEKVLHSFDPRAGDGYNPGAGLIFDNEDNLYGTTSQGGPYGYGTVFEITAAGTEEVLYSFGSQSGDGSNPEADLVFDQNGNLYGTTYVGGAYDLGTVYELTADGLEKVLYSFGSQPGDGSNPLSGVIFDKEGNLYGTTFEGGAYNYGTVFEATP